MPPGCQSSPTSPDLAPAASSSEATTSRSRKTPLAKLEKLRLKRLANPELYRVRNRQSNASRSADIIKGYGGSCVWCGESDARCLTIDHIFDDGAADRKIGRYGNMLYAFLRRLGFPRDRYQLLCWNCQWRKRRGASPPSVTSQSEDLCSDF